MNKAFWKDWFTYKNSLGELFGQKLDKYFRKWRNSANKLVNLSKWVLIVIVISISHGYLDKKKRMIYWRIKDKMITVISAKNSDDDTHNLSKVRQRLRNSLRLSGSFFTFSSVSEKKSLILCTNGSFIRVYIYSVKSF